MEDVKLFKGNRYRTGADLDAWLSLRREKPIEVDLPIIDTHHHLWGDPQRHYEVQDLLADIDCLNVIGTVFVECGAGYENRVDYTVGADAPADLYKQPVAEVRYVVDVLRDQTEAAGRGLCDAIVGFANLLVGEKSAREILEALILAGEGRFRGIRQSAAWDPYIGAMSWRSPPPGLLLDDRFQAGFHALSALGLSFDAWLYYPQIYDLILLAKRFPDVTIIANHFGGILGVGYYAQWPVECFKLWRTYIRQLSEYPNVIMKMGGLGMPASGLNLYLSQVPPSSEDLSVAWKPYIDACVEAFGANRCMIGSNFPVDRQTANYTTLWNAYKLATQAYSKDERHHLFSGTASRVYNIQNKTLVN